MSALRPGQYPGESVSDYAMRLVTGANVHQRTMLAVVTVLESETLWRDPESFTENDSEPHGDYARFLRICEALRDCAERLSVVMAEYKATAVAVQGVQP